MPRAVNLLRADPHYRASAFTAGLQATGFDVTTEPAAPRPGDVLLIWNRYGYGHSLATQYEHAGCRVLVAENCPFGNSWRSGVWYSLARSNPAVVGGGIPDNGPARWDAWGVEMLPWRTEPGETVVFGQRCIGNERTASPPGWGEATAQRHAARLRPHPGTNLAATSLSEDLRGASRAMTWASSAALHALVQGVPVWCANPVFVAAEACAELAPHGPLPPPKLDTEARLRAMRRLAWGVWSLEEIRSGAALRCALGEDVP